MSIATHIILGIAASCWLSGMVTGQLQNNAPDAKHYNSRDAQRPIRIRQPGGRLVEMKCSGQEKRGQSQPRLRGVLWHYMKCGKAHNMTPCNKFVDSKNLSQWEILTNETFSHSVVTLHKTSETNNGLYRCTCTIKNKLHPKILTTYELDLVDKAETRPEILSGPRNQTVNAGGRAMFQCQVLSKIEPTIRWFRREDLRNIEPAIQWFMRNDRANTTNTPQFLKYFNDTYEPMMSDTVYQFQDKYLSKLTLMPVGEWDAGLYVCIALNNVDFIYQGAYLNVIPSNIAPDDASALSLSWLFLIPVGLAGIPLTVWLCCLWHRRKRSTKTPVEDVQQQANLQWKYLPVQKDNLYTMKHYNMPLQCNASLQSSTPMPCGTPHCNTPVTSSDYR